MVAIILALASAISYGGSDFAAGLASRSADVIRVILIASLAGLAVILVAFPLAASHPPGAAALIWGVVVGLSGTVGALALYLGFRHAAFSVAGPLSAVGAAGFSVLAGLLLGEHPTALALTGIVLALPAIVGVSASAASGSREPTAASDGTGRSCTIGPGRPRRSRQIAGAAAPVPPSRGATTTGRPAAGVAAGLVAGAGFALVFIGLNQAGAGSGLWPVAVAQVAEIVVICGAAR